MWSDRITNFMPHKVWSWTRPMASEWRNLLTKRGIYVDDDRKRDPAEAFIEILYQEEHVLRNEVTKTKSQGQGEIQDQKDDQEIIEFQGKDGIKDQEVEVELEEMLPPKKGMKASEMMLTTTKGKTKRRTGEPRKDPATNRNLPTLRISGR